MLQVVLVLVIYLVLPALTITWAIKRFRSGEKPEILDIAAVIFAVSLVVLLMFAYSGNVSDDDSLEVHNIVDTLVERYDFPVNFRYQEKPAVTGIAHARHYEIRIYGVEIDVQQQRIIDQLKKIRRQMASKPIVIYFIREEVWQENADGSRHPLRDQEELLKKIRLE